MRLVINKKTIDRNFVFIYSRVNINDHFCGGQND